jgi:hypothetical protein
MKGATMSDFGKFYWGIRITRNKKPRTLYVHADRIQIQDGDLLLFGHLKSEEHKEPASFLFRSFARGTWQDIFAADCLNGNECSESHDIDDATGKDASAH